MKVALPTDPKVRSDGACALPICRKERTPAAIADEDPFCSTRCCRLFHGLPDPDITYQAKVAAA